MTSAATLAVLPARGGSKRIPRKNIRPFHGVPLLARTLAIVREAGVFDRVIVSTDDDEIAGIARAAGGEVPFRRPAELADDFTATIPVVAHAIAELERSGARFDSVCCIYPASILSTPADYRAALELLRASGASYVFAAASFEYPVQRALRQKTGGGCEMLWPQYRETRSQDLEPAFHDAGQFYFGRTSAWSAQEPLFGDSSRMYLLPRRRAQDIDTLEDWQFAELLYELLTRGQQNE